MSRDAHLARPRRRGVLGDLGYGFVYFRRAPDCPLVRDFAVYLAVSAAAFAAAVAVGRILLNPTALGMVTFGTVQVTVVAVVRLAAAQTTSPGTFRSLLRRHSGVDERSRS